MWRGLSTIADFLGSTEVGLWTVEFGWGSNLPIERLWQPSDLTAGSLEDFVQQSEREGIYQLGRGDLVISDVQTGMTFIVCHESDLHFISDDEAMLDRVSTLWRAAGFEVWVSPYTIEGRPPWRRPD